METLPSFHIEIVTSIADIPSNCWDTLAGSNPFLQHAFLLALEETGCACVETGWQPYHLCLKNNQGDFLGAVPLYIKSHSYGEYVFDHAWANAYERAGGRYYPKLQSSIPFSPVTGARLLCHPTENQTSVQHALLEGLKAVTEQLSVSSTHLTFLREAELPPLEDNGFLVRHDKQYHWQNNNYTDFEAFLSTLSSRKRKQIRKERKTALSSGVKIQTVKGTDITESMWDAFFTFYLDTGAKKWGQPYLNKEFFMQIGKNMPDNIVLFLCTNDGKPIAAALNIVGGNTLYGRYWGCIEHHPCLHFEACYYQAIDYAIKHNIKTVEAGAQGEHKLARGYVPTTTYSAHWIPNDGFREAVANFLVDEKQQVAFEKEILSKHTPFKKG